MLTSVWAAHIQVPTGPCDGMSWNYVAATASNGNLPPLSSWCQSPLFALCPRLESKEQKCYSKFWLFPNNGTRLSISLFLECLVWNTDLLASGLSLASQGHSNQRLRAHTLTSEDARDRVGLDATLSFNPSKISIMELWFLTDRGASENELLKRVIFPYLFRSLVFVQKHF